MWLLVEWTDGDDPDVFPSYAIIKKKYVLDKENLQYGKFIRVRDKRNKKKRRARIMMISDSKGQIKEQKKVLDKRDLKVRAILSKCVRKCRNNSKKIKAKKPEPEVVDCLPGPSKICMLRIPRIPNMPTSPSSSSSDPPSPKPITIHDSSSTSPDSDEIRRVRSKLKRKLEKLMPGPSHDRSRSRSPHDCRKHTVTSRDRCLSRNQLLRSRSMVCNTRMSSISNKPPKIYYDMTTQTDPDPLTPLHTPTVKFFSLFIKELYSHFLLLIAQIEELQASRGENEPVRQNQNETNSLHSLWPGIIYLPADPERQELEANEDLEEILKGVQFLGGNSQDSDENESADENAEDLERNAPEVAENAQNLGVNAQEVDETDEDSDEDTQESNENDQDSDDNDQDSDDMDQIVDVNNQMADVDMQELEENHHDLAENLQVLNQNVPVVAGIPQNVVANAQIMDLNVPVVAEIPQNVVANAQIMDLNVPVVAEIPQNVVANAQIMDINVPMAVPLAAPVLPVFAEPRLPSPKPRKLEVRRVSAQSTMHGEPSNLAQRCIYGDEDMVAIGYNRTLIPRRLLNDVNWGSYTTATRQLLQAVFPRRVLATHSLSGKPSPAFANHPRKERLDPKIVDDIVLTVRERCGVEKQWVRSVITTKCTDEARLYRNRQNQQNRNDDNQENQDPQPGPAPRPGVPLNRLNDSSSSLD